MLTPDQVSRRIPSDSDSVLEFTNSAKGAALLEHGTAVELLNFALGLCKEEFHALHNGYVDIAVANHAVRSELLDRAWDRRHDSDTASLRKAYEDMDLFQKNLTQEARSLQTRMRAKMNTTKQAGHRLSAYKKNVHPMH